MSAAEVRCDIWTATTSLLGDLAAFLSPEEQIRAKALARRDVVERFTLAAGMLRLVVADALGVPPRNVDIRRACPRCGGKHGRPRIDDSDLEVSVAHSGTAAVVAVSRNVPVGVDIELVRPLDYEPLLGGLCHWTERHAITDAVSLIQLWTRKEAVLKATGDGLTVSMNEVVLTMCDTGSRVVDYPGRPDLSMTIHDLAPVDGYKGAIAAAVSGPIELCFQDAARLVA